MPGCIHGKGCVLPVISPPLRRLVRARPALMRFRKVRPDEAITKSSMMPHEQQSLPVLGAAGSGASQPLNSSRHLLLAAFGCVPRDSVSRLLTLFVSTAEERKFTFTCHGEPRRPHGPLGATTLHQSVWRWNQPAEEGGQPSIGTPEGIPRTAVDAAQLGWEEKGSHLPDARVETGAWPWRHGFILRTGSCSCPASLRLLFCGPLAK